MTDQYYPRPDPPEPLRDRIEAMVIAVVGLGIIFGAFWLGAA